MRIIITSSLPWAESETSLARQAPRIRGAHSSGGRCLFLFAVERDDQGRDVFKQIADKLA